MKKQVLITMTLVGMTLAACSKKDSYRAGKLDNDINGGLKGDSQTEASIAVEQKALEILEKDTSFMSVQDNQLSENLKDSINGIEVKQMVQETENTDISVTQFTILDKESKDCSPVQFNTQGYTQEALRKGVKIKGKYRLQCINSDCNDLLLFSEKYITAGPQSVEAIQASAVVRLSKDENGVYKPVQSESDVFAKVQSIDDAIQTCLTDKATKALPEAHGTNAESRKASDANVDADKRRLYQVNQDIGKLQSQLKNSSNSLGRQAIQAEIDSLNAERVQLQKSIQQKQKDDVQARDVKARKEYAASRKEARLLQIEADIKALDAELANTGTFSFLKRGELNKKRADLVRAQEALSESMEKTEKADDIEMIDPTGDM